MKMNYFFIFVAVVVVAIVSSNLIFVLCIDIETKYLCFTKRTNKMFDTLIWRLFIRIEAKLIKMFMSLLNDI